MKIFYIIYGVIITILLFALSACGSNESIVEMQEIVVEITTTPGPSPTNTVEPAPQPTPIGGGTGALAYIVGDKNSNDQIYLKQLNEQEDVPVGQAEPSIHFLSWSPNGGFLAYQGVKRGNINIFTLAIEGNLVNQLTEDGGFNTAVTWSPDGSQLAYLTGSPNPRTLGMTLQIVNVDGSNIQSIYYDERAEPDFNSALDWSPEGDELVVGLSIKSENSLTPFGEPKAYLIGIDGNNIRTLTNESDPIFEEFSLFPKWSPNSNQILFISPDKTNLHAFIISSNNANSRPIAENVYFDLTGGNYSWSPDGKKIAFSIITGGTSAFPETNLAVLDVNSGEMTFLTTFNEVIHPSWSPDGQWIAFAAKSKENAFFQIYIVTTTGGDPLRITATSENHSHSLWQP